MTVDLFALREIEDKGVAAIENLSDTGKWAALIQLVNYLNLRITQVNMSEEKLRCFKRECEGNLTDEKWGTVRPLFKRH